MNSVPTLQALANQWAEQQTQAAQPVLAEAQLKARAQLRAMHFPDRKTEDWKYTSLHSLVNPELWQKGSASNFVRPSEAINSDATLTLRFINGTLENRPDSSAAIELYAFDELSDEQLQRYLPLAQLNSQWQQHPFAQLCEAALVEQSWLLVVKAKQRLEKPIVVEQWNSAGSHSFTATQRLLVVVEANAEASLVQITDSTENAPNALLNSLVQIELQDNAKLNHIQLQLADENCSQVQCTNTQLKRDSRYQHYLISLGTALIRNDLHVQFTGPGAEATLNGAFLSKHQQHVDNHLNLEHISGRCQSSTNYKGLVTDSGKAVFNGRIHIHPDAQKTDAQLNNKNLLLSDSAEINTKPELEIYADDVKCAHGASIGKLNENALFYFESRGIDKATAEAMLSFGFVNEIVEMLPEESLIAPLTKRLARYFRDVKQLGDLWQV